MMNKIDDVIEASLRAFVSDWSSQDLVDSLSPRLVSGFELLRTHATEMTVATRSIVERLDIIGDGTSHCKVSVLEDLLLDALFLQTAEEGFRHGIVRAIPFPAHAGFEVVGAAEAPPGIAAVLGCPPQILRPACRVDIRQEFHPEREPLGDDTGPMPRRRPLLSCTVRRLLYDLVTLARLGVTSRAHLAAENLFLRKQLALYQERRTKPRRPDLATRVALVLLSRLLDWRSLLTVVRPDTLVRWHRQGWRLFWRWTSRPGRPPIPVDLRRLIITMARANPTWGEERIADELRLKLGLAVSPRTIGRYLRQIRPPRGGRPSQRWATFVRNHAHAVLACDFFITVTARFRLVYVFVVLEVGTRRIIHWNVTEHPTADWTIQQFRSVITPETAHRFVLHDRDGVYAAEVDRAITSMGRRVLKTPVRTPPANAFCERLIGTMRRECLDWLIPLTERHLRQILRERVTHYNRGRPHASLGPGIPDPSPLLIGPVSVGHHLPARCRVVATPILGGLHHEYGLESQAA